MELSSQRLVLRILKESDLEIVHEIHSFPESAEFNTMPIPQSLEESRKVVQESLDALSSDPISAYCFCIEYQGEVIGLAGMFMSKPKYKAADTWCKINPAYWNQGFATEVLNLMLDFGFNELKLHRISAGCAVGNHSSRKVMEKAGMTLEGTQRKSLPLQSGWVDTYEFAILETDPRQ